MEEAFIKLYSIALAFASRNNQIIGENNDYYITLEQLQDWMMALRDSEK